MSRFNRDPFNRNLLSRDPLSRDPFNHDPFNRNPLSRDPFSTAQLRMDPFNMDRLRRDLFNRDPFNKGDQIIIKNKGRLTRLLSDDDSIFKDIHSTKLLTTDEHCKLDSIQDPSEKSKKLLDLILNKGSGVCNDFLTLLKEDMVNESRPELRQRITKVETYSCSSDNVNGSRPEVRKYTVTVNTIPGSSDVVKGAQVNESKLEERQLKAKENPPSEPTDANVSSIPTQVANQTTKETNVSSTLPNAGDQTRKDTNVSSNPPEDDNALIKDNEQFLKENRAALIQKVKNVVEITDDLQLISAEQRAKIQAGETDQDKMRLLLDNTTSKAAAKDLVDALLEHAKDVMDDLINAQ